MKTVHDCECAGKRVLVRTDYNVPTDKAGKITDDFKIKESIPTIRLLLERGAIQVILMTHLGRPDGKVVESLRLDEVAKRLSLLMNDRVAKVDECINLPLPPEKVVLLENLRFHPEEEKDDATFAQALAEHADIFVNDAFSVSHRAHASVHAIAKILPSYAGLLLQKESENLAKVTFNPKHPYVAIIGGAKADKIEVINALLPKIDQLIIGGMLANTFLKAKGHDLGASKYSPELIDTAKDIIGKAGNKLILPIDLVFADKFEKGAKIKMERVESTAVAGLIGVDIGSETVLSYTDLLKHAETIFWAGPIGVFEIPEFAEGTKKLCVALAALKSVRVIGGGDSAAAVEATGHALDMTFISTAGGASLEFVAGKKLPGLEVLGYY